MSAIVVLLLHRTHRACRDSDYIFGAYI